MFHSPLLQRYHTIIYNLFIPFSVTVEFFLRRSDPIRSDPIRSDSIRSDPIRSDPTRSKITTPKQKTTTTVGVLSFSAHVSTTLAV